MSNKISIIIPTYYRNDLLRSAVSSVYQQSYRPVEVIVVDDSGESHAQCVVDSFDDIHYIPLKRNLGQNAALNRGISEATGEYIQFLDDDDEILDGKLSRQVKLLASDENVEVAYCGIRYDDGTTTVPLPEMRGDVLEPALAFDLHSCVTSTMLIERELLEEVAPLPTPPGSTDIYMKIEFAQRAEFEFITDIGILKRDLPGSVGSSEAALQGQRQVFDVYGDVYDRFPESVRNRALAAFYNRTGAHYLSEGSWSFSAIVAFARAVYYNPGISPQYVSRFFGSLLGRPGITLADQVRSRIGR